MTTKPNASPVSLTDSSHHHGSSCWWDYRRPGWVCPPTAVSRPGVSTTSTAVDAKVDVRDMVVVHTAMLREFRLLPHAVRRAPQVSRRQVAAVSKHLVMMCTLLHHHHAGEDELLWPVLTPRLTAAERSLVELAEGQHAGIEQALDAVAAAHDEWSRQADVHHTDELARTLEVLYRELSEHLDAEERHLLPLAAVHLTTAEWAAIGEAGKDGVPKSALMLVFGMFAYEGDPAVLAQMLHAAPPPVRLLVPRLAPRVYARHSARIHGTRTP